MNERGSILLKFLDKYLGIPLLFFLGCFKFSRKIPAEIKTIALLKTAAIGDTVLLTGIVKDLKKAYPSAKIILFTGGSNFIFAKLLKDFDRVEKLPIKNILKSTRMLREYKIDLLLDFGAWPRINALFSYLSGARYLIGFNTRGQYRHYIYDSTVNHSDQIHEIENYRNILRALNLAPHHNPSVSPENVSYQLASPGSPYVVCHLSAGGEKSYLKELSINQWSEVCRDLFEMGLKIYLTGAAADFEKNEKLRLALNCMAVENVAGIDLAKTLQLLSGAKYVISVNTGIMHIASCMGVKTIGIHGPTSIKRWGPIGSNSVSVATRNPKGQYLNLGFEYQEKIPCMQDVQVKDIQMALRQASN